jgi:hypothetical protein
VLTTVCWCNLSAEFCACSHRLPKVKPSALRLRRILSLAVLRNKRVTVLHIGAGGLSESNQLRAIGLIYSAMRSTLNPTIARVKDKGEGTGHKPRGGTGDGAGCVAILLEGLQSVGWLLRPCPGRAQAMAPSCSPFGSG